MPETTSEGPGAPPAERRFSFACFPMERVLVLVGVLAGPSIAAGVLWQFRRMSEIAGQGGQGVSFETGDGRLFAGLTIGLAVALVVYGLLFLQARAATWVTVGARGLRLERLALLPFGLLARRREMAWRHVRLVALRERRTWLGARRPTLEVESPSQTLRLSVADAWEVPGPPRPWMPRPPGGSWSRHPLVEAATAAFARVAAESPSVLKSEAPKVDSKK